jgi:hypothetical protein
MWEVVHGRLLHLTLKVSEVSDLDRSQALPTLIVHTQQQGDVGV